MYMHRIFALQLLVSCSFLCAADTQKQSLTERWIQLAHWLQSKTSYFHWLPIDVQENIFSRIHPSPSLDDWRSNDMLCVRTIIVPHHIVSFDLKGDRFAYMSPRMILNGWDKDKYLPHWIDLQTGEHRVLCEKGEGYDGSFGKFPAIQLCGDVAIVEEFSPKHFAVISLFDKPLPDYLNNGDSASSYSVKTLDWNGGQSIQCATHPSLPLCAVSYTTNGQGFIRIYIYENAKNLRYIDFNCSVDDMQKHTLTWHCTSNNLFLYKPCAKVVTMVRGDNSYNIYANLKIADGVPYFSPADSLFHAKYGDDVKGVDIVSDACTYFNMHNNNFLLRGVGHVVYLTEKSDQHGVGIKQYSLHTCKEGETIPLTELDNLPPLHKLPSSHDYRRVTVETRDDHRSSTIEIFVPKTKVMFQHYCMLQAALEAQKSGVWHHFRSERNKQLVEETKEGYALFGKLMGDNVGGRKTE